MNGTDGKKLVLIVDDAPADLQNDAFDSEG